MKISAFVKQPGSAPYHTWLSDNLENLQRYVGGYIETVTFADGLVAIVNEEGIPLNLAFNCEFRGHKFYGPVIFVGVKTLFSEDGDEFCDVPYTWDQFKIAAKELWK